MSVQLHICLIGTSIGRHGELVEQLSSRHGVILLPWISSAGAQLIGLADVVAVDCRERRQVSTCALVKEIRELTSGEIVVMNGGLAQDEVAHLLSAGARDYFPEPFNVALIAERLEHLAATAALRPQVSRRNG